ncbi:hypothetical protein Bca101_026327 [Brassica carinata]
MGRKDENLIAQEKAEAAQKETARFGKKLGSMPESEEERRQQALAMLRHKSQAKKDGKRVVDRANKQPKNEGKRVVDVDHKITNADGKRLASDEKVLDDAYKKAKKDGKRVAVGDHKHTPSKKARAPRSHSVGPLVLEKNTKKDAEKPTPPTKIRIKAPNPKTLAPPPLEQVDETVEEASSPNGSVAEQENFEKLVPTDFYAEFGRVGFFVRRLMYYKDYAWKNRDPEAQIGIGGLITPLLVHRGISLGDDASGPSFIDLSYLKSAHYFSGRYNGRCVYSYLRGSTTVELLLPNYELTSLSTPGTISFDISEQHLLGSHGTLGPMVLHINEKAAAKAAKFDKGYSSIATAHLFRPPRYKFEQCTSALPIGPIRQAHDQISTLQRWNRAQDRTIFKLTKKCKELRKTVKRQAEASAQFMRKVADVLTRGAVAGCKAEDFDLDAFLAPPPLPLHDPNAPQTEKQALRSLRNPYIAPSASGNMSPSLSTTADEDDSEGEASASSHAP